MKYKENWDETKERFCAWWRREKMDRPLMKIVARRDSGVGELKSIRPVKHPEETYLNVERKVNILENYCKTHVFLAESFPSLSVNIGPGSMAIYLGSEPMFTQDTVWFKECIQDTWEQWGQLKYDPDNHWWKKHIEMVEMAVEMAKDNFLVDIPDIVENVDILAAMRGAERLCYDLIDSPELMKNYIEQIDDLYFCYYDKFYSIVKKEDGSCSYTAFDIWGPGKTAKIQCDFSALMSPGQFEEFVVPSLRNQCKKLDFSLYHLDGPDAVKHLDALLKIDELDAVQWTPGAGNPDGANERWYPIYDEVKNAGKGLWISIYDGDVNTWSNSSRKFVDRYGCDGVYMLFPAMDYADAERVLCGANKKWK